jgi:hypothetical protein
MNNKNIVYNSQDLLKKVKESPEGTIILFEDEGAKNMQKSKKALEIVRAFEEMRDQKHEKR